MSHCLNEDHAQHFHPQDIIWLLSRARMRGIHTAAAYLMRECGYADPVPIEPEDEAAALMRAFNHSVKVQRGILDRMEKLNLPMQAVS